MSNAGRPEKPITATGPVPLFAEYLREQRRASGRTFAEMSAIVHFGASTLSKVSNGKSLKAWEQVEAYVKAVDGDLAEARIYYDITVQGETIPWTPPPSSEPAQWNFLVTHPDVDHLLATTDVGITAAVEVASKPAFRGLQLMNAFSSRRRRRMTAAELAANSPASVDDSAVPDRDEAVDVAVELGQLAAEPPGSPHAAVTMADFAELLDQLRVHKRLSWRKLSEISGMPSTTMHEAIVKRRNPGLELTRKIVQLCLDEPGEQREWVLVWERLQVWETRSRTALLALQGIPVAQERTRAEAQPQPPHRPRRIYWWHHLAVLNLPFRKIMGSLLGAMILALLATGQNPATGIGRLLVLGFLSLGLLLEAAVRAAKLVITVQRGPRRPPGQLGRHHV